jgi:hypothetical protein
MTCDALLGETVFDWRFQISKTWWRITETQSTNN